MNPSRVGTWHCLSLCMLVPFAPFTFSNTRQRLGLILAIGFKGRNVPKNDGEVLTGTYCSAECDFEFVNVRRSDLPARLTAAVS